MQRGRRWKLLALFLPFVFFFPGERRGDGVKAKFESRPHMWWALAEALSGRGARLFRALVRACVIGHASLKSAAVAAARYRGAAGTGLKQRGA